MSKIQSALDALHATHDAMRKAIKALDDIQEGPESDSHPDTIGNYVTDGAALDFREDYERQIDLLEDLKKTLARYPDNDEAAYDAMEKLGW